MSPTKDLEYPSPIDVPDEPAEPDVDEDLDPADPSGDALDEREYDPDSEDTPSEDDRSEDGGDPLVQKGPLVEDVPESEKFPTL